MSPFSDEHYKAIVSVSRELTSIIQEKNQCAHSRVKATDALCKLVDMLGVIQCDYDATLNPISGK